MTKNRRIRFKDGRAVPKAEVGRKPTTGAEVNAQIEADREWAEAQDAADKAYLEDAVDYRGYRTLRKKLKDQQG